MNVMNANGNGERHKRCSRNGPSAQHLGFWFQFGADGGSATARPTGTQNCCTPKHAVRVRVAVALGKQRNQKQHGIVTKLPHANHNPQVPSPNFIRLFLEQKHSNISRTEMMMPFQFGM